MFQTSHGWNKWRTITPPSTQTINDVTYMDSTDGIVIGNNTILKTTDKGETWFSVNLSTKRGSDVYNSVYFNSSEEGFIVGANGTILHSTDKGSTWELLNKTSVATDLLNTNELSLKNNNYNSPEAFKLSQNYPNPFNPSTMITYYLPQDSHLKLKVYDMTGKEVATLVNEFKSAGSYSIQFNSAGLSSGIYFYSMIAESGSSKIVKTMKMILAK
jgi:hypothetical protein